MAREALRRPLALLALLALLGLGSTACGSLRTRVLDPAQVAKLIEAEIEGQTGAEVASVSCPDDVVAKEGGRFRCTAVGADGSQAQVEVTQTSGEGNLAIDAPLLHTTDAEREIARDLGGDADVDCPELIPVKAGAVVTCTATAGGDEAAVEVTFKDGQGNFEYQVRP